MSDLVSYSYTVLRYVHDVVTGEFLNVGVVLYCPERKFLRAKTRKKTARLTHCFRGADGTAARQAIKQIEAAIRETAKGLQSMFPEEVSTARDFAAHVLPHDDSSLQWSPLGAGRTRDPNQELERLFDRMVARYDTLNENRKTESDVWRTFSRALARRNVSAHWEKKTIASDADSITFQHAWKNGRWHCLEPLSFDLVDGEAIRNKARRYLGQVSALSNASDEFTVYFLLGEPTDSAMQPQFEKAVRILQSSPTVPVEVFRESQADEFSAKVAKEIQQHNESERARGPWDS